MNMTKHVAAILEGLVMLIFFSLGSVLMKIVLQDVRPFTFTWTTVALGMVIISLYTFVIRREKIPRNMGGQVWWCIIIIGIGTFIISGLLRPLSIQRLPVITNTYLGNFVGLVTMGFSIFIMGEIPSLIQIIGTIVALLGIIIFFNLPMQKGEIVGIILVIVTVVVTAITNNVTRKMSVITDTKYDNNMLSAMAILIGGSGVVLAGLIFDFPPKIPNLKSWGIIIFYAATNITLYVTVWNHINRVLRSYEASILGTSTIIYTTFFAMVFLGERLTINKWIGMGIMMIGLLLVQIKKNSKNKNLEFFPPVDNFLKGNEETSKSE